MATLQSEPLDARQVEQEVCSDARGGVVTFLGTTRDHFEGRRVVSLEYEAYEDMALAEMRAIEDSVAERWPGAACSIHHRLGSVPPGEVSVIISVATPHRAAAFEGCRFAIDTLKARVPIFKKERYEDGSCWKANVESPA